MNEQPRTNRTMKRTIGLIYRLSKCPSFGYYAFNGQECYDCGYENSKYKVN